jgi:hypothetical protein
VFYRRDGGLFSLKETVNECEGLNRLIFGTISGVGGEVGMVAALTTFQHESKCKLHA